MKVEQMILGSLDTNCYLVYQEKAKECLVIDPAADAAAIRLRAGQLGLRIGAILLTHGHFDHILAADELRRVCGCPIYAAAAEQELLGNPQENLSGLWASPIVLQADRLLSDGELLQVAGLTLEVLVTPGHTKGSVCYQVKEQAVLFSGDTLFYESYGRTDLPGGSMQEMISSIRMLLHRIPEETMVYPGHGSQTDIAHERIYHPLAEG